MAAWLENFAKSTHNRFYHLAPVLLLGAPVVEPLRDMLRERLEYRFLVERVADQAHEIGELPLVAAAPDLRFVEPLVGRPQLLRCPLARRLLD